MSGMSIPAQSTSPLSFVLGSKGLKLSAKFPFGLVITVNLSRFAPTVASKPGADIFPAPADVVPVAPVPQPAPPSTTNADVPRSHDLALRIFESPIDILMMD